MSLFRSGLLMSPNWKPILHCLVLNAVFGVSAFCPPLHAQTYSTNVSNPGIKIVSVSEKLSENTIFIKTESAAAAGRPAFNYLPGSNGETILTADFDGLAFNQPTRIIRLNSPEKALNNIVDLSDVKDVAMRRAQVARSNAVIKEIHIGQFQQSPPKVRISFVSMDPKLLKTVSIGAAPGLMKITWGAAAPVAVAAKPRDVAPHVVREVLPKTAPVMQETRAKEGNDKEPGPKALDRKDPLKKTGWFSRLKEKTLDLVGIEEGKAAAKPGEKQVDKPLAKPNIAPPVAPERGNAAASTDDEKILPETAPAPQDFGPPPSITLERADALGSGAKLEIFRVEMPDGRDLSYKSFRLHNPERYVIDIPDLLSIEGAKLPDLVKSSLVDSLRVGVPDREAGTGRLVLQLVDNQVMVQECFNPGSSYLTLTLGKGLGQADARTPVAIAAPIATGPIIVPRAPGETLIVLDAGHGGSDPGAQRGNVDEKDLTMGIINKLKKVLEAKGARTILTRSDDTFISLEERVRITNLAKPNLFLSVHINSLESTSDASGIETYYQTEQSRPLADRVHESLVSGLGAPDRSVRKARFYVINHTPVPAILAEVGYITNKTERDRLISSDYQLKIANALARGTMLYLQEVNHGQGSLATNSNRAPRRSQMANIDSKSTK